MPHFVIEYAREIESQYDIKKIMQIAYDSGVQSGVMQAKDIKVRAKPFDHFRILNEQNTFVHTTVFLLSGRSDEQKQSIALILRENLTAYLTSVTSVSIDVRDMNSTAYKKRVLPISKD